MKRPGTGISPMKWDEVIGKVSQQDFAEDELITISYEDLYRNRQGAEYGLLKPLIEKINADKKSLATTATGAHLSPELASFIDR